MEEEQEAEAEQDDETEMTEPRIRGNESETCFQTLGLHVCTDTSACAKRG